MGNYTQYNHKVARTSPQPQWRWKHTGFCHGCARLPSLRWAEQCLTARKVGLGDGCGCRNVDMLFLCSPPMFSRASQRSYDVPHLLLHSQCKSTLVSAALVVPVLWQGILWLPWHELSLVLQRLCSCKCLRCGCWCLLSSLMSLWTFFPYLDQGLLMLWNKLFENLSGDLNLCRSFQRSTVPEPWGRSMKMYAVCPK